MDVKQLENHFAYREKRETRPQAKEKCSCSSFKHVVYIWDRKLSQVTCDNKCRFVQICIIKTIGR